MFCIIPTCNPPVGILIGQSRLFHPGEKLFAHCKLIGALRFGPPWKLLCMLVGRGSTGAPKTWRTVHRLAEESVRMAATVVVDVALHFHEMCTAAPFDLLVHCWQPNVTWQVSREPKASGLRGSRREKKRKTESGRRLNDPSYQLNSKLTWMASRAARQNEDFGWKTHKNK